MDNDVQNLVHSSLHMHSQMLVLQQEHLQLSAGFCLAYASLDQLRNASKTFLHPTELEYLSTLNFSKRQQSYLLGRYTAKAAIIRWVPELLPKEVAVTSGIFDHPIVYHSDQRKIQVTISHTSSFGAAIAFPEEYPLGIDLEPVQNHNQSIIDSQLTTAEKAWIDNNYSHSSSILYTIHWTLKEALSKVLRTGMMSPFEIYAIQNLVHDGSYWTSTFQNFAQYQGFSFPLGNCICSIVYPKQMRIMIDLPVINTWMQKLNHSFDTIEFVD